MTRTFPAGDLAAGAAVAVAVQIGFFAMLHLGDPKRVVVDLSDENARPVAVQIVPMVDDLPMLKLGGKKVAGKLPDMWLKPKASHKKSEGEAQPSTKADTEHTPTTHGDAGVANDASSLDPIAGDAATDPNATTEGNPGGVDGGTEKDPLKAHALDVYRAQIQAWFNARFHIKGKLPFDKLKTLKATAVIDIGDDRKVTGYDVVRTSSDDTFDDQLYKDLAAVQVSGAVLPPPPENYPDILGKKLRLTFQCTQQAACE